MTCSLLRGGMPPSAGTGPRPSRITALPAAWTGGLAGRADPGSRLAEAVSAIGVAVLFARELGPVPDQEAGVAGKLVFLSRDDRDGQLFTGEVSARQVHAFRGVGLIELAGYAACIGCVRRAQGLQRGVA